jgi:hypothetical protein
MALYQVAVSGFMPDPVDTLRDDDRRQYIGIGEWLLTHPKSVQGSG